MDRPDPGAFTNPIHLQRPARNISSRPKPDSFILVFLCRGRCCVLWRDPISPFAISDPDFQAHPANGPPDGPGGNSAGGRDLAPCALVIVPHKRRQFWAAARLLWRIPSPGTARTGDMDVSHGRARDGAALLVPGRAIVPEKLSASIMNNLVVQRGCRTFR